MAQVLLYRTSGDIIGRDGETKMVSTIPGIVDGTKSLTPDPEYPMNYLYSDFNINLHEKITIKCSYERLENNRDVIPYIGFWFTPSFSSHFSDVSNFNFKYANHTPGEVHELTSKDILNCVFFKTDNAEYDNSAFKISMDGIYTDGVIKNFTFEIYAEVDDVKEYCRSLFTGRFGSKKFERFEVNVEEENISLLNFFFKMKEKYYTIEKSFSSGTNSYVLKEVYANSDPMTARNLISVGGCSLETLLAVRDSEIFGTENVEIIAVYAVKEGVSGDFSNLPISLKAVFKPDFSLIKLAQIEDGLAMQDDVQALKTSYDALKVLTNISKGEDLGNYNVNELLVVLKATLDSITGSEGGSGGSGGSGSLIEIQQQINIINNKVIKDVVKLQLQVVNNVIVMPDNYVDIEVNIDKSKTYPVYNIDNTVIFNENGGQLMFNFETKQFIGIPSKVDPNCKDPQHLTYVKIDTDFEFKVFAIGSFTFVNLPADALLDNQEMTILAYNQVLNQIIVNLSNNTELIAEIKTLISNEVIQQQITAITNVLEQRITAIEVNGCKVSNEYISTVINDVDIATDIKVTSEKAVAIAIANASVNIKNEINTNIVNVNDRLEALESMLEQVDRIEISDETVKTEFTLSKVPNSFDITLNINGVEYFENEAFTANRAEKKVTWTATKENGGFDITRKLTPVVRVLYKVGEVMEYTPGESEKSVTVCDFNAEDNADFLVDGKVAAQSEEVVFDGIMKPNTVYNVAVGKPEAMGERYCSESEEIDFTEYKKVEELK